MPQTEEITQESSTRAMMARPPEPTGTQTTIATFPPARPGDAPTKSIVKHTAGGQLRSMLTNVKLDPDPVRGHVYMMGRYVNNDWTKVPTITALGYDRLNTFIGISFVNPETVVGEDGKTYPNPHIKYGERGEIEYVRIRMIGVGRNAAGNLVAHDYSVTYDLRMYLTQDMWSKWTGKKKADKVKAWGKIVARDAHHRAQGFDVGHGTGIPEDWAPYKMPGGTVLFVDLSNREVLSILGEHISRQKFAERNAATICRRNILKKATAVTTVDDTYTVPVVGWVQTDRDLAELAQVAADANAGKTTLATGEELIVDRERATAADKDEVDASLAGEGEDHPTAGLEDEKPGVGTGVEPITTPAPPVTEEIKAQRKLLRKACSQVGADKANTLLGSIGIDGMEAIPRLGAEDMATALKVMTAQLRAAEKKSPPEKGAKKASKKTSGPQEDLIPEANTPDVPY